MLNKALMLSVQKKKNGLTTGKFTITNGYWESEEEDMFGDKEKYYGYYPRLNLGTAYPEPVLDGKLVTQFCYWHNQELGWMGVRLYFDASDSNYPDGKYPSDLLVINHTTGENFIFVCPSSGTDFADYVPEDGDYLEGRTDLFSPEGSNVVWEIQSLGTFDGEEY